MTRIFIQDTNSIHLQHKILALMVFVNKGLICIKRIYRFKQQQVHLHFLTNWKLCAPSSLVIGFIAKIFASKGLAFPLLNNNKEKEDRRTDSIIAHKSLIILCNGK